MKNFSAIILLFVANSISGMAQGISMIAIPWYFAKNQLMQEFAWIYVLTNVISFFWVPFAGTMIDRYNRKNIFLGVTVICGSIVIGIALLGQLWGALPWFLISAVFMTTFFNYNIHYPNLYAYMQEIVEPKYYGKVNSYVEIQGQLTTVLSGAGAAMLLEGSKDGFLNLFGFRVSIQSQIEAWQIHEIFLLDGATYVLAFLIIIFIRHQPLTSRHPESGSFLSRLKVGYDYLRKHPAIFEFGVFSYSIFVAVLLVGFYLGAQYVTDYLHASGDVYAASEMWYALGALFAGIAIRRIFRLTSIPLSIVVLTFLAGLFFGLQALVPNEVVFYGASFLLGLTNAGTRVQRVTYLFQEIPNQVYGRANSIYFLINILLRIVFLSMFSLSFFHRDENVAYAFGIVAVFLLFSGGMLVRNMRPLKEEKMEKLT